MAFPHNPVYPPVFQGREMGAQLSSLTNPYWMPEPELVAKTTQLPIDHHLGFSIPKPWPLPSPQMIYNGSGQVPGVREMVFTQFTNATPVGGTLPHSGKRPLVRPSEFRREQYILIV